MTYLNSPRLHFAGQFRADVSTVNNEVTHFRDPNDPADQGWNPSGGGGWALVGCKVTRAVYQDATVAQTPDQDPVIGLALNQIPTAVLVDLDPQQQLASQIWGLRMQLGPPDSPAAFRGAFQTTAFSDLWTNRARVADAGDSNMTAFYHSVLTGVVWNALAGSRLAAELQQNSAAGLLSIKFNVDGFENRTHVGRIVGTIGPARADEPAHFVRGRHIMGSSDRPVSFFPAVIDAQRGKLVADFGNALQTTSVGGPFDSSLHLEIGTIAGDQFSSLGRLPIGDGDWYEQTAGVCEFPADRALTAAELTQLGSHPIAVRNNDGAAATVVAVEGADGKHVRAENFVYRLSANESANVTLHATQFGQPLPNAKLDVGVDSSMLQAGPQVCNPADGVSFPASVITDANGIAQLPLAAAAIDRPRDYIDGQVYGIGYSVAGSDPAHGAYANPWNFVSVLVWSDYHAPAEPTWKQDVEPILGEYAQLYPVMKAFVDLADYASVVTNKGALERVFTLPQDDPNYMPVTRSLSPAKRQMILAWLQTTGNAGKPNFDRGGPHAAEALAAAAPEPAGALAAAAPEPAGEVAALGGKTLALQRLLRRQ
jgi:hypothetical protein